MIKIENEDISGFQAAIRGMRNPMNSWDKSDSLFMTINDIVGHPCDDGLQKEFVVGNNDYDLMKRLVSAGSDHSKFMRMINVTCDITAPLYWWAEYDTYKVGTVRNSCSKMHKLLHKPFEMSDFSFDQLIGYKNEVKQFCPEVDEETEIWKATTYCNDYEVSNQGRVRHGKRILGGSLHNDGYIFITIKGKQIPLSHIVAEAFIKNPENKPEVNHKDGNRQNNFVDNLEWNTSSENQEHAIRTNLQPKGLSTYKGKFSKERRNEIKALWNEGKISKRRIAEVYNVSHTCITNIINDKYKYAETVNTYEKIARPIVDTLNELRDSYLSCGDSNVQKEIWYTIMQLLPQSYNQKATVQLNYAVLRNMYHARKSHKLSEWHELCNWIMKLPYGELITMEVK